MSIALRVWLLLIILYDVLGYTSAHHLHFALKKRGGRLARHEPANLTRLAQIAAATELQYIRTGRHVDGNRLARKWSSETSGTAVDEDLLREPGQDGKWFFLLAIGTPPQSLEVDLDMLSTDFYHLMTTSKKGSKYNDLMSSSHVSNNAPVHPICRHPSDTFHLPQHPLEPPLSIALEFAMCQPSKSSPFTLRSSGSILGLGPPTKSLKRIEHSSLLQQLFEKNILNNKLWSLTLLDAENGILTIGGTVAREMEESSIRSAVELSHLESLGLYLTDIINDEVTSRLTLFPLDTEAQFRWSPLRSAFGWWTPLLSGLWLNGAKVLKNQPMLLDVQSPFILAPPLAARRFYESISGARRLPVPHERFYAFPCLNRVNIAFELAGWMFPSLKGETRRDAVFGPSGGSLSLGQWGNGSGYCVGVVVEEQDTSGSESGLEDTWVLGEPFFKGMGVVFDAENSRVGFRTY